MCSSASQHPVDATVAPLVAALVALTLLAGCGDRKDKPPTQTAAKVNKEELTVHQINAVLSQQRGLSAEQGEEAGRRILERLIDRELAVQKAAELRLDRDPGVVQAIEATRRDIVARAYADKIAEGAARPSPAEIKKYYDDHPALFRERRVYQLQEFFVQASSAQVDALRERLRSGGKSPVDVAQLLKAESLKFASKQVVRPAEQVPLDRLGQLAALKDGQFLLMPVQGGAQVVFVLASRAQVIDEASAAPAIEQFLVNDQKRKLVAQDLKALRAVATIEYVGKYAGATLPSDDASGPSVADAAASAAAALEEAARAASEADAATVRKGLGLK